MKLTRTVAFMAVAAALAAPLAAAGPAVAGPPLPTKTSITLTFTDCSGCRIAAFNTESAQFKADGKPLDTAKVHKGKAVFQVPTALTRGLAFTLLTAGKYTMVGAHPDIALDVAGIHAGRWVSAKRAREATGARRCWAGTRKFAVTIPVSAFTYRVRDYTQGNTTVTSIALWASPDQKGFGTVTPFDSELRGYPGVAQLANQDAPYCT
jgi:hypothetical protein